MINEPSVDLSKFHPDWFDKSPDEWPEAARSFYRWRYIASVRRMQAQRLQEEREQSTVQGGDEK